MMPRKARCAAIALAGLAVFATARSAGVPEPGPAPVVSLPARDTVSLPNGLAVTLVPYGHVPKTTILISIGTGTIADGDRPGVARLSAELMKLGVRGQDAGAFYRRAAQLGGDVSVGAGVDTTVVSMDVLAEHAPQAIALLADVIRHPTLPGSELGRLKSDLKRSLSVGRSRQQGIAADAFAQRLYGNGPRGRRLHDDDVDAVSLEDVRRFVTTELSAARTRIYVAGRYDRAAIDRAIRRAFGDWPAGAPARVDTSLPSGERSVILIDRPGAQQSTIMMGLPVPSLTSPVYTELSMANALLGGAGLMSRLDQNLREEKGWTYGVSTQIEPLRDGGLWMLFTDVNTPDTAAALREIFRETTQLAATAPSPEELKRVQNYRAGHFLMGASSREGLINQLAFVDQHHLGPEWLPGYVQRIHAVSPDGVRRAAQFFDSSRMTLVVAGDLSKIKSEIEGVEALQGADFH
jgi:zinc protease